jgi:hypothetical protein
MRKTFLLLLLFAGISAHAVTRFVATTGTDTGSCTSAGSPCLTIAFAAGLTNAGDIVQIAAGTYNERITLTRDGSSGSKITFQGFPVGGSCPTTVDSDTNSRGFRPAPTVIMKGFHVSANFISLQCIKVLSTGTGGNEGAAQIEPSHHDVDIQDFYVDGTGNVGDPCCLMNAPTSGGDPATRPFNITVLRGYVTATQFGVLFQCNNCSVQDTEMERMQGGPINTDHDYIHVFGDSITVRHNYAHGNRIADCAVPTPPNPDCHIDFVQTWNVGGADNQATNIVIDKNIAFNEHEGIIANAGSSGPYTHANWTVTNNVFAYGPIGDTIPWCAVYAHVNNITEYNNSCFGGGWGFQNTTVVAVHSNNIHMNGGFFPYEC